MGVIMDSGVVARALPTADGLSIKLQRGDGGTVELDVPGNRPELQEIARRARMTGETVSLRHTEAGMVVMLQAGVVGVAA